MTLYCRYLYGRGSADMKSAVAAFVVALELYLKDNTPKGTTPNVQLYCCMNQLFVTLTFEVGLGLSSCLTDPERVYLVIL